MTKKDYIAAAKIIRFRTDEGSSDRTTLSDAFVVFFKLDNLHFDEDRFRDAVYNGEIKARRNAKKINRL